MTLQRNTRSSRKNASARKALGLVLFLAATAFFALSCSESGGTSTTRKVLILGMDGMDPQLLERFMAEGKLPNFRSLALKGNFRPLATSVPPQSPVAWSNFITGLNPGGHGIFDFIHRDPETYLPYLSTSKTEQADRTISIGQWILPLSEPKVLLMRKGATFWEILDEHGVPATIFRIPSNFPPVKSSGRSLSGMGTPDILGTYGTFSYFTDSPVDNQDDISGGKVYPVQVIKNRVNAELVGPKNTFKKGSPKSTIPFIVWLDPDNPVGKIVVQDNEVLLNEGEWSDWVQMEFEAIPYLESVSGICRFYLKEVRPDFKLYVTPINIDPSDPALPISTPEDYSRELWKSLGCFYTQGMPEDTKALSAGILSDDEYLQQTDIVLQERLKMFDLELERFNRGLLFFYFSSLDQNSHMFWRTLDKKHPTYDPETSPPYEKVIEHLYEVMDDVLGKAMEKVDDNTTLIVMSDHGFAPYRTFFHLNTWLKDNGYVTLINESRQGETEFFMNVDWGRTRAYGLGLNSLYVNLRGREAYGIVEPGAERQRLLEELSLKLLAVRDPETGRQIISQVFKTNESYSGPCVKDAPDLIIGYNWGYRASWETTLGKFPKTLLGENEEKWSGDHCIDAALVPGILVSNRKLKSDDPALYDLTPTILAEFGIAKPTDMVGDVIF